MMKSAIQAFIDNFTPIMAGNFRKDLFGVMSMSDLGAALQGIMKDYIYSHIEIAHREQTARSVIDGLLSTIFYEMQDRPDGPLAKSTYGPAHLHDGEIPNLGANYQLALRATDYVSGMTDGHALAQYQRISGMLPTF
jgi:dGTP triphosphohydrolase